MKKLKVVGLNFDHMHMGDLLRLCHQHRQIEIVGICDPTLAKMENAIAQFGIPNERVFTDVEACLVSTRPDFAILCPATADHASWVERVAAFKVPILIEKPFASSLADADRMIRATQRARCPLAINWPLRWYPAHATAHRLLSEGRIGTLQEVHYYDGNRGPLFHLADKIEANPTASDKRRSWFYRKAKGGGSLLDYLGYGTTLGTWFHGGKKPIEVTTVADYRPGVEVDEHSISVARYATGLSQFETRWGTFSDPWSQQPQPKCGFVLKGEDGTLSSYDFEPTVRLQTRKSPQGKDVPVDKLKAPFRNPIEYFAWCIQSGTPVEGPLSPKISRIGQQIVDTAMLSARTGKTQRLLT